MKLTLIALALIAGFAFSAQAEEAPAQDHQQHHAAEAPADKKAEGMPMMGGKMDMGQMHAMMGECMKMHKDGKMCEGQMMEQCQKNMNGGDCSKMMKKAKKMK